MDAYSIGPCSVQDIRRTRSNGLLSGMRRICDSVKSALIAEMYSVALVKMIL